MAGELIPDMSNRIAANPGAFNPFDSTVFDWISQDEAPDEDTLSSEQGHAVMSGYLLDHDTLWNAVAYFVGLSKVNPSSTTKLTRWMPAFHPRWPQMVCDTVSVKGIKRLGRAANGIPFIGAWFQPLLPLPKYERYRFDVHFIQPQMNYTPDMLVSNEWQRYLTVEDMDETEVITVDGGQYVYNAPTDASLNGTKVVINGPSLKVYAQRSGLKITAHQIPADFIYDTYHMPLHFLDAKGKVNSTTFLNRPAGTMLLTGYQIHKRSQPVATNALNMLLFGSTVEMHFSYTNPTPAEASETRRGWQLVPGRGGTNKWYGITNSQTGENLFPTYDMNKLLQHYST